MVMAWLENICLDRSVTISADFDTCLMHAGAWAAAIEEVADAQPFFTQQL